MYGLRITEPFATLIARGIKTVETRRYKPPASRIGEMVALIGTGKTPSIVGVARLSEYYLYANPKAFRRDYDKHLVPRGSLYDYTGSDYLKTKSYSKSYGWVMTDAVAFREFVPVPKYGGRIWTKNITFDHWQLLREL